MNTKEKINGNIVVALVISIAFLAIVGVLLAWSSWANSTWRDNANGWESQARLSREEAAQAKTQLASATAMLQQADQIVGAIRKENEAQAKQNKQLGWILHQVIEDREFEIYPAWTTNQLWQTKIEPIQTNGVTMMRVSRGEVKAVEKLEKQ